MLYVIDELIELKKQIVKLGNEFEDRFVSYNSYRDEELDFNYYTNSIRVGEQNVSKSIEALGYEMERYIGYVEERYNEYRVRRLEDKYKLSIEEIADKLIVVVAGKIKGRKTLYFNIYGERKSIREVVLNDNDPESIINVIKEYPDDLFYETSYKK